MLKRSIGSFFRSSYQKISSEDAISRIKVAISVLDQGIHKWGRINNLSQQKEGCDVYDNPSRFLSDMEQSQIKGITQSLGISYENKGLVAMKQDLLEKLTELHSFEIEAKPAIK